MKKLSLSIIFILLVSCGPMHKYAKHNEYSKVSIKDTGIHTLMVKNKELDFILYGHYGSDFAMNNRQFHRLKKDAGTPKIENLDNVLVYGFTSKSKRESYPETNPIEFYLLLNPKKEPIFDSDTFISKDTIIDGNEIKFIVSKNAPKNEVNYIWDNIHINYGRPEVDMSAYLNQE